MKGTSVFVRMWQRHNYSSICIICTVDTLIWSDKDLLFLGLPAQVTGINIFFFWISPLGTILNWVDQSSYINVRWTGTSVCISLITRVIHTWFHLNCEVDSCLHMYAFSFHHTFHVIPVTKCLTASCHHCQFTCDLLPFMKKRQGKACEHKV